MKRGGEVQVRLVMIAFTHVGTMATIAQGQDYKAILANPERPEDERALDAGRKPEEVLKFFGVKVGDKVADIMAARGYYTTILSQVVGPQGIVYSVNNAFIKGFVKDTLDTRLKNPMFANVKH